MSVISSSTRRFLVETGYWMASGGDEDFDRFVGDAFASTDSALIDVAKGGGLMAVATSTQWSEIEVTATVHDSEPPREAEPWDSVSDVTLLVDPPGPEDEESCIGIMAGPVPEEEPDPIFPRCPSGIAPTRRRSSSAFSAKADWLAILPNCRRLHRRYERKAEHFLAFVGIAAALISYRRLATAFRA
ncbi:hypothetical protein [Streptomyces sp. NPDC003710]